MSKSTTVDRARPTIPQPKTPEAMVTEGKALLAGVNASSNIGQATDVAAAAKGLGTVNDQLDANNAKKAKAKGDLQTAEANELPLVRRWGARRRALASAIELFSDGSKDVAKTFSVAVEEKHTTATATTPENLRPMKAKKHTAAGCRWNPTPGAHGYMVQHCSNPADPSTYSPQISCSKARFWLDGQTPGATVNFRVLACDERLLPSGQSPYTAWVAVLVS